MKLAFAYSLLLASLTQAALNFNETTSRITIANDRLTVSLNKSTGAFDSLTLDSENLLGRKNGSTGIGPYLDCYCVPSGAYTPFQNINNTIYTILNGTDATGTDWVGIIFSEIYAPTNQSFQQYFFLRDRETGLHTFTRLEYFNSTTPFLRNLQELRTLFRPNGNLWTHLSTNEKQYAPLPKYNPAAPKLNATNPGVITVQDATWFIPDKSDPYVQAESSFFTKYTFSDSWRDHTLHGLYSDGSQSSDGDTYGAWFVMNTIDTYFGGPTHSDLTVDGIVYNYIVSNHHGDQTPNITDGFERTFGPGFYYFNHGEAGETLQALRSDAERIYDEDWTGFYDSIAHHVPGYIASSERGAWSAQISLPEGSSNAIAILSVNGTDFQDNVIDTSAYQYWSEITSDGSVTIKHIKAGTYRLTVYASGIFGQYIQDEIIVEACEITQTNVVWKPDCAGTELFRIGTPDKSSGEYLHGDHPDLTHPLHPAERRIYFAVYDFVTDFPNGVKFHVGNDSIAQDLNYVHWSVFGGYGNSLRTQPYPGVGEVNNWTIIFDTSEFDLRNKTTATFTVQLAGAKTAAGNTDVFNATQPYSNLPYTVSVNSHDLEPWIIPYYQSSSCAVRSAVSCYHLSHKFEFGVEKLLVGRNEIVLSLPWNATNYESAHLVESVYVQYDALRLEVR